MPPVIAPIIGALVSALGVSGAVAVIDIVTFGALIAGTNFIVGKLTGALIKKPNFSSIAHDSLGRSIAVRPR